MMIDEARLARIIFTSRKKFGYTQTFVSEQTKITQGTLSKIESYVCSVSAKHWFLLSDLLNIPSDAVYTGYIDRGEKIKDTKGKKNPYKLKNRYFHGATASVKDVLPFLRYFKRVYGEAQLMAFYEEHKLNRDYFIDLNNPINPVICLDAVKFFTGKPKATVKLLQEIAEEGMANELHGIHTDLFSKKSTPVLALKAIIDAMPYYDKTFDYSIDAKSDEELKFTIRLQEELVNLDDSEKAQLQDLLFNYKKKYFEKFFQNFGGTKKSTAKEVSFDKDNKVLKLAIK